MTRPRDISAIGADILRAEPLPYGSAVRYAHVMRDRSAEMTTDDIRALAGQFLDSAKSWRGPVARRIKRELRALGN